MLYIVGGWGFLFNVLQRKICASCPQVWSSISFRPCFGLRASRGEELLACATCFTTIIYRDDILQAGDENHVIFVGPSGGFPSHKIGPEIWSKSGDSAMDFASSDFFGKKGVKSHGSESGASSVVMTGVMTRGCTKVVSFVRDDV